MKHTTIYCSLLMMLICACKQDTKKLLVGKWHVVQFDNNLQKIVGKWNAVAMANPAMDSFFKNGQHYIDTVGKNNDAATNKRLYGAANMDSIRLLLQKQFDSARSMQESGVTSTTFYFGPDGVAILSFHGNIDSSSWDLDSAGYLVLDDLNETSKGEKVRMEIMALSDTMMQLKFMENNTYSVVTFHPDGSRSKTDPIVETFFNFRPDGIAELTFNGVTDSTRWLLENDTTINVTGMDKSQPGDAMKWNISSIEKYKLKLRIVENGNVSNLTFSKER